MTSPTFIDRNLLNELSAEAAQSPRLRKNRNFHTGNDDACHRLLNALEPGTYIQPHCHLAADKEETLIVLYGRIGVLLFDETGAVTATRELVAGGETVGVNVAPGVFHSLVALEAGSVFFESKAGPYAALGAAEKPVWAPSEGEPGVEAFLAGMLAHFAR
ncbi:WbuC family cupin fold metalloprotein [Jeongeupia naejangsanensis]|uniref:WbuC family cupin fold metalloprotein n=1 Tax=Jeongeupia naejangsanensis TaxID=613195 RepID=A0ABS2BIL9_9NEIS|nr:WbuC family cupin fold metalloprotein [Jeongeupia naejangsanensis]MBM3115452.1 WbuC family cupin fold metalloprotein [Jeongeupia naejangsanensis]